MDRPNTLLAIKAIGLVEGLNASDRRVGIALLESFNRRTHRCDPGIERIAKLLSISERTVMRSTQRLAKAGLFRKRRHGGYGNRNSYEPVWEKFAVVEADWRLRFAIKAHGERLSRTTRTDCHLPTDSSVTQTYRINQTNLTFEKKHSEKAYSGGIRSARAPAIQHDFTKSSMDAARAAAQARWDCELLRRFVKDPQVYARIVDVIDVSLAQAATEAELQHRGAGAVRILQHLAMRGITTPEQSDA